MRTICIYPGRFQPFHKSHYGVYKFLVNKFGASNVYIVTSDKVQKGRSPFNFKEKQKIINRLYGVPTSQILFNPQPYKFSNLSSKFDSESTVLVYVSTQKDKRLTGGGYFKGELPKDPKPYSEQAYVVNAPLINNQILGVQVSGTTVRQIMGSEKLTIQQKKDLFTKMFGSYDKDIFYLIAFKLGGIIKQIKQLLQKLQIKKMIRQAVNLNSNIKSDFDMLHQHIYGVNKKKRLNQGGRAGHMMHPFQDNDLTFTNFKKLINNTLNGNITIKNNASIKYDGKNIFVSWKNGRIVSARRKQQTKNFGAGAMGINDARTFFTKGVVRQAFVYSMIDLQRAFSKLGQNRLNDLFGQGKNWINLQIIYDKSSHDIPYDQSMLVFHSMVQVNERGEVIGQSSTNISQVYNALVQVNANTQKHFKITGPSYVTIPKTQNFAKDKAYFLKKLNQLQAQYNLKGTDTMTDYHKGYWRKTILRYAASAQYDIPKDVLQGLVNRWGALDKSFTVHDIKRTIDHEKFKQWALRFDKADHMIQYNANKFKWEVLFLQLGATVLKNLSTFMIANPDNSIKKIKAQLDDTIKLIYDSKDVENIAKMQTQLKKLEAIGGVDAILPVEGIVFDFNGSKYKITGAFTPVHHILSLIRFAK